MSKENRKFRDRFVLPVAAVLITACDGGNGDGGISMPPPVPDAVFSDIQANVFTTTCATSGCHAGAGAPQGLLLDEANSYMLLVGVQSGEVPALLRVNPGDPDNSYLVQKLEGTAASGEQMPLGRAPLPQATIDVIRQWISEGALDDRVSSSAPVLVSSLAPAPESKLSARPDEIIAEFDRALDASTVNANTFLLEGSGGDGSFDDANEVPIDAMAITVPAANPKSAIFDLAGVQLDDDIYRVTLKGEGPSVIMDQDANVLDGEFGAGFPSGDGTEGGDFATTISIETPMMIGPTLDQIQAAVFTPSCATAGCHTGATGNSLPSGMDLSDADASFASMVGISSLQQPAVLRVAAGDPDNSYLVQKIEGTAGTRMPAGGRPPLDPAVISEIRQWILDGGLHQ